jgi:hypothetical protein
MSGRHNPKEAIVAEASKKETTDKSGVDLVTDEANKALEQGFIGEKVDPEPNEVYTIAGVTKAKKS